MKCSTARRWIDDHMDGKLNAEQEKMLESHLAGCVACRELLEDFHKISSLAKKIPSLEPSPAVWEAIAARVKRAQRELAEPEKGRRSWIPWLWPQSVLRYAMVSLLALILIGGLVVGLKTWRWHVPPAEKSLAYTMAKLKEAQRYYEKAIASLEEAVKAQANGLDPQLTEMFQSNLKALDETIQACQNIVNTDPDNVTVRTYLLTAYHEKVNFLEEYMGIKKSQTMKPIGTTI